MRALAAVVLTVLLGVAPGLLRPGPGPVPARERLLGLAAAVGPAAGDASFGRYSRIRLVRWVRTGTAVARFDSERWRASDGSGRLAEGRPGDPVVRTDYPPGGLVLRAAGPGDGPTAVVTSLLDMIGIRYLGPAERSAALRTLAAQPGLVYAGPAAAGLAFTLPVGDGRPVGDGTLTVTVGPATGEVTGWGYGTAERVEVLARARVPSLV